MTNQFSSHCEASYGLTSKSAILESQISRHFKPPDSLMHSVSCPAIRKSSIYDNRLSCVVAAAGNQLMICITQATDERRLLGAQPAKTPYPTPS